MRKYIIGVALLIIACTSALAQDTKDITTRFGVLTVNDERELLFKGHPLDPPIQGNNSLDLSEIYPIGTTDVVLATDNGGTACPAIYHFVTISKSGAKATRGFGTCSELATVKRTGDSISVSMPGFAGPFESKRKQRTAGRETHVFIFRAGVVTENGKRVK